MTVFDTILDRLLQREGFHSNDADDSGRETVFGITRGYDPEWIGWPIFDAAKTAGRVETLRHSATFMSCVAEFYYAKYWACNRCDQIAELSPAIAEKIFDAAVKDSPQRVAKWFQRAVNAWNCNETRYENILVDGKPGNNTLSAFRAAITFPRAEDFILRVMNGLQIAYHVARYEQNEVLEKYTGWILERDKERYE
jgi:lysozyme family protein